MIRKLSVSLAALAAMGIAGAASADQPTDTGAIVTNAHVYDFVEITVLDSELDWDVPAFDNASNDLSGIGNTPGEHRARFEVAANTDYALTVNSNTGCWQAAAFLPSPWSNYRQVKFEHDSSDDYIGGSFYLDRNPAIGTITHYWDGDNCNLVTGTYGAETHVWGLSAAFAPSLVGNPDNPLGEVGKLPAPGTYTSTAIITAATQ